MGTSDAGTAQSTSYISSIDRLLKLITGKAAARFAKQLGMDRRFDPSISRNTLADRFESFVGALWAYQGSGAVLELLAPLFAREMPKPARQSHFKEVAESKRVVPPAPAAPLPDLALQQQNDSSTTAVSQAANQVAIAHTGEWESERP